MNIPKKQLISGICMMSLCVVGIVILIKPKMQETSPSSVELALPEPILSPLAENKIKAYDESNKYAPNNYKDYMDNLSGDSVIDSASHQLAQLEKALSGGASSGTPSSPSTITPATSNYSEMAVKQQAQTEKYLAELNKLEEQLKSEKRSPVSEIAPSKDKKIDISASYSVEDPVANEAQQTGFITAIGGATHKEISTTMARNNIVKVSIMTDSKVITGQRIMIRTLEDFQVGNTTIPKNAHVMGTVTINSRMMIYVSSMEYAGQIYQVSLRGYDVDGIEGIYCPETAVSSSAKEITSDALSLAGTSVGGSIGLGADQVLRSATKLFNKSKSEVSVSLPAGYQFYLYKEKN